MTFAAPYMLWGLLSVLVPVLIHLWSKREQRVVRVGSIQFFEENESIKSRRIQLNELLLLFLRCLLIAAITLWLAGIRFSSKSTAASDIYLVDPALAAHPYVNDSILTLDEVYWLQPGYPDIDEADPEPANFNRWRMAAGFSANSNDSVVILASDGNSGYDEIRPSLAENTTWISLEAERSAPPDLLNTRFYPVSYNGAVATPNKDTGFEILPSGIDIFFPTQDTSKTTSNLLNLIGRLDKSIPEITFNINEKSGWFGIWTGNESPPDSSIPWIWIKETSITRPYHIDQNMLLPAEASFTQLVEWNVHHKILNYIYLNDTISSNTIDLRSMDSRMISPPVDGEYSTVKTSAATWWPILLIIGGLLIGERFLAMKRLL